MSDNERSRKESPPPRQGDREARSPEPADRGHDTRRGRSRKRHGRGGGRDLASPVTKPRRLNLDLPVSEPLGPEEQREMSEHLAFLRQFKPYLGLSLNAAEDLLVNGARPPTDRGMCKHLLSKVDRRAIDRALGREAVKTDASMRARLLAGVVRISPDVATLLAYLEALTWISDRREASGAFGATIGRIDFTAVSATQMAALLDVIGKTFDGHDRVQALFGLLASDTFERALDRTIDGISPALRAAFAPLSAAHRAVQRGEPPRDPEERALVAQGVGQWLAAPERTLKSYPVEVRRRLVIFALADRDISAVAKPLRILLDSLPQDASSLGLAITLLDRLIASKQEDVARGLLNAILQTHPQLAGAKRRQEALSWPRVGRLAIAPDARGGRRVRRAFSLDLPGFVWVRTAPPAEAVRVVAEAELHAKLVVSGVVPCLDHGRAGDGTAFAVMAPGGRAIEPSFARSWSLRDAFSFAAEGVRILYALAHSGAELPDASVERFVCERPPTSLRLLDLDGVKSGPVDACIARCGERATAFVRQILGSREHGGLRPDVPAEVVSVLRGHPQPAELAALLDEHAARAWDSPGSPPPASGEGEPPPQASAGRSGAS